MFHVHFSGALTGERIVTVTGALDNVLKVRVLMQHRCDPRSKGPLAKGLSWSSRELECHLPSRPADVSPLAFSGPGPAFGEADGGAGAHQVLGTAHAAHLPLPIRCLVRCATSQSTITNTHPLVSFRCP